MLGFSKRTIKIQIDNLRALGSEIIRGVHFDEDQRKLSAKDLLLEYGVKLYSIHNAILNHEFFRRTNKTK